MNFPEFIYKVISEHGEAAVPNFGTFKAERSSAHLDQESSTISPPAHRIVFFPDYDESNQPLILNYASETAIQPALAEKEVNDLVSFWRNKINAGESFEIQSLGRFLAKDEQIEFVGDRIAADSPDFYGLEEINLSEIRKKEKGGNYKFNKALLWTLILLGIAGLGAAAYYNQETLFGKKSFENQSLKSEKIFIVNDSVLSQKKLADSLKTDSLKQDSIKKIVTVPAKKWTGKKYYKKSKWKQKKRRNHSR